MLIWQIMSQKVCKTGHYSIYSMEVSVQMEQGLVTRLASLDGITRP